MSNLDKYDKSFLKGLQSRKQLQKLKLFIEQWDSIAHMNLMSELESAFKISIDTDDIIDFSSFKKGKKILKKYKIEIRKNKFQNCIIKSKENKNPFKISKKKIINIYKKKRVLIFKGFNFNLNNFKKFPKIFTNVYARDANRRKKLKDLNYVDSGNQYMSLHSEASFSPSWPEIVWFYGKLPTKKFGETTLCCGKSFRKKFNFKTKSFLKKKKLKIKHKNIKNKKHNSKKNWDLNEIGVSNCFIDRKGFINFDYINFAMNKSKFDNKIYLASHILYKKGDDTIMHLSQLNGKKIPPDIVRTIENKAKKLHISINGKNMI